ncbi:MAG: hypothetical protein KatS3mg120_0181 [Erythrobacter sp.]|nr:MAG: hypothetical protein KatS3mg120_0181 [Erythrobacter sp.]
MSSAALPTAAAADPQSAPAGPTRTAAFQKRLARRYRAERNFRLLGLGAVGFSVAVLIFLLGNMLINGIAGFQRTELAVTIDFPASGITGDEVSLRAPSAMQTLELQGLPDVITFFAEQQLGAEAARQITPDAWRDVAAALADDPSLITRSATLNLPVSSALAAGLEGEGSPEMQALAKRLAAEGKLARNWDWGFLARSDATTPQAVGIWGALKGTMLTMLVTLVLAFPVGVLAALYLEEYAPRNRWTDLIEVSINNLAAVPSIIFGLLGLAVFLALFPSLRSTPLVGGIPWR